MKNENVDWPGSGWGLAGVATVLSSAALWFADWQRLIGIVGTVAGCVMIVVGTYQWFASRQRRAGIATTHGSRPSSTSHSHIGATTNQQDRPRQDAVREVRVSGGGTGARIVNDGGIGMDLEGPGPVERITVDGPGTGEVIENSGGIGKRVRSMGGKAMHVSVAPAPDAKHTAALKTVVLGGLKCPSCGHHYSSTVTVTGHSGEKIQPPSEVTCPRCSAVQRLR